ncbi:hypothetical protein [Silvibacterium sp.]|uniref:MmyB family transcriptional regulator n=1 Tax=Silvibacterium sp. TaxID=1964179 RepID=UPI0039E32001
MGAVLRLTEAKQGHSYRLAGHPPPYFPVRGDESVVPVLQRMIHAMDPNPACGLDPVWNIVAWNPAAVDLFGEFRKTLDEQRNMDRLICWMSAFATLGTNRLLAKIHSEQEAFRTQSPVYRSVYVGPTWTVSVTSVPVSGALMIDNEPPNLFARSPIPARP